MFLIKHEEFLSEFISNENFYLFSPEQPTIMSCFELIFFCHHKLMSRCTGNAEKQNLYKNKKKKNTNIL